MRRVFVIEVLERPRSVGPMRGISARIFVLGRDPITLKPFQDSRLSRPAFPWSPMAASVLYDRRAEMGCSFVNCNVGTVPIWKGHFMRNPCGIRIPGSNACLRVLFSATSRQLFSPWPVLDSQVAAEGRFRPGSGSAPSSSHIAMAERHD